jgi:hypothetical protein
VRLHPDLGADAPPPPGMASAARTPSRIR